MFRRRGPLDCSGRRPNRHPRVETVSHGGAILGRRVPRHASQIGRGALEAIERLEAITIARLHGHVIGGGLVLALGCDFPDRGR
jgi:hypothetical protein